MTKKSSSEGWPWNQPSRAPATTARLLVQVMTTRPQQMRAAITHSENWESCMRTRRPLLSVTCCEVFTLEIHKELCLRTCTAHFRKLGGSPYSPHSAMYSNTHWYRFPDSPHIGPRRDNAPGPFEFEFKLKRNTSRSVPMASCCSTAGMQAPASLIHASWDTITSAVPKVQSMEYITKYHEHSLVFEAPIPSCWTCATVQRAPYNCKQLAYTINPLPILHCGYIVYRRRYKTVGTMIGLCCTHAM